MGQADTTRYVYDAFGSLVSVTLPNGTLIEYMLDGNGLRIGRKVNGAITQKWIYSNNLRIVAETDSANTVTSRFVYTTSENVPEYMVKGGIVYRIVTDHLGSVNQVVNMQTGAIVQQVEYDEYGNIMIDTNPEFVPFGFAGGLHDPLTKLVRFGARDYEARVGRWTLKDPIKFQANSPNLFAYVRSEPINQLDPNGLVNWTKLQVAVLNWYRGNLQLYGGMVQVQAGLAAKSPGTVFLGATNMLFGASSLRRSFKQFGEAMTEPASNANNGNYLGLLPFGDYFDDPQEREDIYNQNVKNINTLEEIWRFLSDPMQMFLR